MVSAAFLVKVAAAAGAACGVLVISALPNIAAAALAAVVFLGVGEVLGMVPREVQSALDPRRLRQRRG
jgi:hypothetical protein